MVQDLPPRSVPVLIKLESGRVLAGIVATIYYEDTMLRLDKVALVEIIGLKHGLEPIYGFQSKPVKYAFIKVEDIVHWELLPGYLKLDN